MPFTVATAAPAFGRLTARFGLFAIPEETVLPPVLRSVVGAEARRWRRPLARTAAPDDAAGHGVALEGERR